MFTRTRAFAVALAMCLSSLPASAQINPSHLTGTVKDAQGAVLPGVTVTATSPALLGTQAVVTEAGGSYRFASLPSGTYAVTFELQGFQTMKRDNIVLGVGQTLTIDATLQIATLQETVTVTSESPVVDTQSTAVGYVQTTAQLVGVPSSTDLWGALAQTPGVRMQGVDVGGSHKSQQSGYEAFGIRNQARVITDGVDTTEGSGGAGFYQDYFAQNEVAVSAAGGDVSMNTPGAAIVSTIKSGGNEFHGLENIVYEGKDFVGDNISSDTQARGFTGQPNLKFWEGHVELGGPVLKDRAWFYAAYNHFKIDKVISGIDQNVATDLGLFNNFTTKESYKASSKDTLIGYYQWGKKEKPLRGLSNTTPPESALAQTSPSWAYNGRWQRTWSNRLFSEVNVGDFGYTFPEQPNVDFATHPPRHDQGTGADSGAGWFNAGGNTGPFILARDKPQAYGNLTYYLPTSRGSHDLKAGFEFLNDKATNTANGTSGPVLYLDRNGATNQVRITDYGTASTFGSDWTQASDYNRRYALYLQDRFTATNRLTLTVGARYDYQRPYYSEAKRVPLLTEVFANATTPGASLITRNTVAPRVGASWDPMGDSKSVVKAFWGRFYFNYADRLAGADPGGANYKDYVFNDLNGNRLYDGSAELGALVGSFGGTSTTIDPNLKTPYTDEIDVSFDRQFWGESSARVAYVRKMSRNDFATINAARIDQYTVATPVNVTLRSFDGGVAGTQVYTLDDIPTSLKGVVRNVIMNIPGDGGDSNYDTLSFAFNKRFGKGLFVNTSFDYQWRDELRQAASSSGGPASSNSPLSSDPIPVGFYFNAYPNVPARQKTTVWSAHVSARYQFKYDIGVAANYNGQAGWPYARLINVSLPNAGSTTFFQENNDQNRSDNVHLLALRVDKAVQLQKIRVTVMFDLFNALNTNAVTNFNLANGANFNRINATVDPRTAQIGFRVEF